MLGGIKGKHMGLVLLLSVAVYGYCVWRSGTPWRRVLGSCAGVFLVARGAAFVVRQVTVALIGGWKSAGETGLVLLVFAVPALIYIAVPVIAFRRRWFGIGERAWMQVVSRRGEGPDEEESAR